MDLEPAKDRFQRCRPTLPDFRVSFSWVQSTVLELTTVTLGTVDHGRFQTVFLSFLRLAWWVSGVAEAAWVRVSVFLTSSVFLGTY